MARPHYTKGSRKLNEMTIRQAAYADRFRAVTILREFHAEARPAFPFDPARAEAVFKAHLEPDRLALVSDTDAGVQGLLLATADEHPFGAGRIARETIWFMRPAARGREGLRMLTAFEAWAAAQGCVAACMACLPDNDVATIYRRRGYAPAETHFVKSL